ncbi:MAG: DUF192 domain-containing protein [Chloroflexi bacterium]|nr:DUF192 domain-containing protein [Chloroflexota bacterium]MDA1241209.1 DUF192 domain-containing protein [Chloroflexota bacterium]
MTSSILGALLTVISTIALGACGGTTDAVVAPTVLPSASATAPAFATAPPTVTATDSGLPVASTASIPTADLPLVRFTTTSGGTATLPVEVIGRAEFPIGFSGRTSIEGRGMLFYWAEGSESGFWMKDTLVPLDIAFINHDLEIIEIVQMEPESLEIRRTSARYLAAVETPLGWYAAHGIEAGARVEWLFDPVALGAGQ